MGVLGGGSFSYERGTAVAVNRHARVRVSGHVLVSAVITRVSSQRSRPCLRQQSALVSADKLWAPHGSKLWNASRLVLPPFIFVISINGDTFDLAVQGYLAHQKHLPP